MKTLGILGGMGPLATADLFYKIINLTQAKCDRDHIHIITDNYCEIPDRSAYILGGGEDPIDHMSEAARKLESIGADFLVMPCNTAHYFYSELSKRVDIPFLNMIEETASYLAGEERVGLLATEGTYSAKLYEGAFLPRNIKVVTPDEDIKKLINTLIYNFKGGRGAGEEDLFTILKHFRSKGVDKLILGCTELPLIFKGVVSDMTLVDPTEILAVAAIRYAGKEVVGIN
ncbi:aspartate racemase [Propionigenium maris DSM 9537]|uniref:Aspartate racemase n=1 Tax=Propionigenium maris DSM 9537 TaxID=1123000 RepID=A0A9W6GL32_9FUSO|nr:amino acid racemase [Propionigenium maris]GLI57083.1 aspartate racemase [Propionigenium maris DSM 9537]